MSGNAHHVRCEAGENPEIVSKDYLSLLPKIESAEMMFSASRSRRLSIVPIIQSLSQLEKSYGKEGAEIIVDNVQLTIFGGFAPNSETAQAMSKSLGSRTVQTGYISKGKDNGSQSLQMMERPLMTPDELKSMPKGPVYRDENWGSPHEGEAEALFPVGHLLWGAVHCPGQGQPACGLCRERSLGASHPGKVPAPGRTPAAKGERAASPAGAGGQETPRQRTWQKKDKTGKGAGR